MPKGKGTYGSKVGRPSKKYQAGGEVTDVAEVIAEVAQMGQEFPTANAMERTENYQLGGAVRPPTAPSMPQYKKGGKVDITDIVKEIETTKKQHKMDKIWTAASDRAEYLKLKKVKKMKK